MNDFNKQEKVAFDQILENFNDALIISAAVNKFNIGDVEAERSQETIWRPQPYIIPSYRGVDQTARFQAGIETVQRSVPSSLSTVIGAGFELSPFELRDMTQETNLDKASVTRIASDINVEVLDLASNLGSIVVARPNAASGYRDVAEAETAMTEVGIHLQDRHFFAAPRDHVGMAENLAERQTLNNFPTRAYQDSYVGRVANFNYMQLDYANILTAAAPAAPVTIDGADQRHEPRAIDKLQQGQINVDNRFQTIVVNNSAGLKAGDAFTIDDVYAVHHITKRSTGQLKTFRVVEVPVGGTTIKITPAIVAVDRTGGPLYAEEQYQNVDSTPADGAAINFINIADSHVNPFFAKDALELLPGKLCVRKDSGLAVMSGTTDQGVTVVMTRFGIFGDLSTRYRCDAYIGTVANNPEMMGIELFNQQ